jgi:hypothetical protein
MDKMDNQNRSLRQRKLLGILGEQGLPEQRDHLIGAEKTLSKLLAERFATLLTLKRGRFWLIPGRAVFRGSYGRIDPAGLYAH